MVTVHCNESGFRSVYRSDEYGFNNPPGLHGQAVQVIVVGDSFAHGACVQPQDTFAAALRRLGTSTLSLGMDGSGPLLQLAILTEYAQALRRARSAAPPRRSRRAARPARRAT